MEVKTVGPNFGMAMVKTKEAERFINRLPYDKAMKIKVMEMDSKHNPIDYYVSTINKNGKEKLHVGVGYKYFVQSFFKGPVKVIKQGMEFANKLNKEQQIQNELTKGMVRPRLG